ncbi:MAG TPA: glycosyltransferase family 2 protein [Polyangiaceae bacterium LLY-WYZ-15_(1-7)]|nr:glycosyl transferase family 2 [Sandaracinus sp.]HJK92835.1 glycosyltransferase family 2 protein [Polyangiaceae bacterium LLY-WYZ-15_(1-7)]MBJ72288.1 glycosyl transferase family 2 [Sandaracinus sp.]HJL03066.1 glycosyltransferase family 2 protein [Polyangiaceae bacterium LLY-WYZ-15_(1-7)]HJL08454.1 glycosyltransferase family 2 protein [Polyangiaceae bacterium LLY-WYZ-15_(1-7)]
MSDTNGADDRPVQPRVSIIIPVYNEEAILHSAVVDLVDRLQEFDWPYELLLAENGSSDRTVEIGEELSRRFPQVRISSLGEPNYGKALKKGILEASGEFVLCDEIDLCDTDFYARAMAVLESNEADLVIGSKVMPGANDDRPLFRHSATLVLNGMLRVALGFKGTDTHGLKAFRRAPLVEIARQCLVDKDLFASEFVIRAERAGIRIREIPIRILEKRPPSIALMRRVPNVLKNMAKLFVAIRVKG